MRDLRIERVPCPRCGAAAGEPCRTPGGIVMYTIAHFARREAAVDDAWVGWRAAEGWEAPLVRSARQRERHAELVLFEGLIT